MECTLMVGTSLLAIAPLVLWVCVGNSANSMIVAHRIAQNATVRLFIEKRIVSLEKAIVPILCFKWDGSSYWWMYL